MEDSGDEYNFDRYYNSSGKKAGTYVYVRATGSWKPEKVTRIWRHFVHSLS
jgi:hypothetical protein